MDRGDHVEALIVAQPFFILLLINCQTIMSSVVNFNHLSFRRKVNDALAAVERTLELERSPRLAEEVDHTYGAKYELVDRTTNAAIIAFMTCFEKLGLNRLILGSIVEGAGNKPLTLRFDVSTTPTFIKEVKVKVPMDRSYEQTEETAGSTVTKVLKVSWLGLGELSPIIPTE